MTLYARTPDGLELHHGNALEVLRGLSPASIDCCVTSPPYWQLRRYEGVEPTVWERDEPAMRDICHGEHEWGEMLDGRKHSNRNENFNERWGRPVGQRKQESMVNVHLEAGAFCTRCRAWYGCLGLEPDPDLFVEHLCQIFDEVRRVLKPSASLWVNLGDSYIGGGHGPTGATSTMRKLDRCVYEERQGFVDEKTPTAGLPEKSLAAVPQRFLLAMMRRGWLYREDVIWHKKVHMPESVDDRCTRAHEHVLHFTLGPRYYSDMRAVRVQGSPAQDEHNQKYAHEYDLGVSDDGNGQPGNVNHKGLHSRPGPGGHNLGSVWTLTSEPSKVRHFAAYPRAIALRPILISTPEAGVCPECGVPWSPEYTVTRAHSSGSGRSGRRPVGKNGSLQGGGATGDVRNGPTVEYYFEGAVAGCKHQVDPVPATVLDPFVGSGTTLLVARQLGRRGVGIDASLAYLERSSARLEGQTASLFAGALE